MTSRLGFVAASFELVDVVQDGDRTSAEAVDDTVVGENGSSALLSAEDGATKE